MSLSFRTGASYAAGLNPVSLALHDVNGDGIADLVVADANNQVNVLLGDGHGGFGVATAYAGVPGQGFVTVADVNGDGFPDIVVTSSVSGGLNAPNGFVSVLLNDGAGGFSAPVTYKDAGDDPTSLVVADINGDGRPDLLVANYGFQFAGMSTIILFGGVSLLEGTGNGRFGPAGLLTSTGPTSSLAVADVNGDGHPDLVVVDYATSSFLFPFSPSTVAVFLSDGNGGFGAPTSLSAGTNESTVAAADLNGDGFVDLIVTGRSTYVLLNNGVGGFAPAVSYNVTASSITVADVNGDGHPDLVLGNQILLGKGDGSFGPPTATTWGRDPVIADLNGDGYADVVSLGGDGQVSVRLNTALQPGPAVAFADLGGTGQSDVLMQDDDGMIAVELQSNLKISQIQNVGNPGASWHVVGSADFNGDGKADILLQNANSDIVDYLMNGASISTEINLGTPGAGWHVRGTGDFNGDGKADIVLQHDGDQSLVLWETNGSSITSALSLGTPGTGWTVEGVADLNGDGNADLVLQSGGGDIVAYMVVNGAIVSTADLGNPGPGWSVAGTGNYGANGQAGILLHDDDGSLVVWQTDGQAVTSREYLGDPGASFTTAVPGVVLNSGGAAGLVVQSTSSSVVGYTLGGNATITAGASFGTPGIGWHAIGNDPMQFIDGTAAATTLIATPGADQFDLTTFVTGYHEIDGFNPAQDSIALSRSLFPAYSAVQAAELPYQGGTFIQLTTGSALVIAGVTPVQLGTSDFVLS